MNLYPTRTASHLAVAAVAALGLGIVAQEPAMVAWSGGMLLGLAVARAVTLVSVARIRAAGFEMLWTGPSRVVRTVRGSSIELTAEVRNRDTLSARYVKLRAVASPHLEVTVEPAAGEVAASGRLSVRVRVDTPRVGQHGIHGLALEVSGAPGLFEVPLTFANPFGIEVLPRHLASYFLRPEGGRSRHSAPVGRPGRARGDGSDLRELREHQPGDPFRRIAWRATAKRGILLVRDFEREERDVVWLVLDASVELWAGPTGRAPLDLAIDELAGLLAKHLGRGDQVGLAVYATALRAFVEPGSGPAQAHKLLRGLLAGTATIDADRSDLDEQDVALRVLEHLRPLDPKGLSDVRRNDLDKLAARADGARSRAPFSVPLPEARSLRERTLRRYLAAYGIDSPPRADSDRRAALASLAQLLLRIGMTKPRASLVHVVAPPPDGTLAPTIEDPVRRLVRHGVRVSWSTPDMSTGLVPPWDPPPPVVDEVEDGPRRPPSVPAGAPAAIEAVMLRAHVAEARGHAVLRKLGVQLVLPRRVRHARAPAAVEP
jgi:uncharacterized protein (DUF58 family)